MQRVRDYDSERRERNSFVLLQHFHTIIEADIRRTVPGSKLTNELGFGPDESRELINYLLGLGYFEPRSGQLLAMSPLALEYVERIARRRHSVRSG
jgi:hypothetical protein